MDHVKRILCQCQEPAIFGADCNSSPHHIATDDNPFRVFMLMAGNYGAVRGQGLTCLTILLMLKTQAALQAPTTPVDRNGIE